jgi:hypothetical protein
MTPQKQNSKQQSMTARTLITISVTKEPITLAGKLFYSIDASSKACLIWILNVLWDVSALLRV